MFRTARSRTIALFLSMAPFALASAQTQPPPPTYVFTSVESIDIKGHRYKIAVTGVLQGESAPQTIEFTYSSSDTESTRTFERCERLALLAMNKPGRYLLEVRQEAILLGLDSIGCKLTRVP